MNRSLSAPRDGRKRMLWTFGGVTLIAAAAVAFFFVPGIRPWLAARLAATTWLSGDGHDEAAGHASDEHEHDEANEPGDGGSQAAPAEDGHRHDEASALALSQQAKANIGMRLTRVELRSFERTVTIPGMVVERPGWSALEVNAPMTGVVTRIYPIQGAAVTPGEPLFEVRLTHEDLLQKQTDFLQAVEELAVINQEVERLEKVAASGAIPEKTLLERRYDQQRQQAALRVQRQALLLHGLSAAQIDRIEQDRRLQQSLTVTTPAHEGPSAQAPATRYQVEELKVSQGSYVTAGSALCRLVDQAQLYIEGQAFEDDVAAVSQAAAKDWKVTALFGVAGSEGASTVPALRILYLEDRVETVSRTFRFYVVLPNEIEREARSPEGYQFVYWRFKPGQRAQIKVPVETWPERIVLPVDAVAQDGPDFFVFEANAGHFDRRIVHIEYRDQEWMVIANDGALKPGVMVAESAAYQMQLALKNKAGGGVDPHAGHNH